AWFTDAAATLTRELPRIRAVVYYDQGGRCDWRPDTSAPSMRGFVRFARDPFFGPPAGVPATTAAAPTTPVAPTTASSTVRPTTAAPTTPVAPTTTTVRPSTPPPAATSPQPADRCPTSGAVVIGTADNAQQIVDARPAGTTFVVKVGTHQNNF